MEDYNNYLKEQGYTLASISSKLNTLNQFTHWLNTNNIPTGACSYSQVLQYLQYLKQRGVKPITLQHYSTQIKQYFTYLSKQNHIAHNPVLALNIKGVKRGALHPVLSPEELEEIYTNYTTENNNTAAGHPNPPQELNGLARKRNKIIIGLLIYQGINAHTLSLLKPEHVAIQKGLIQLPGYRKSKERTLKLEVSQVFELHEYITHIRPQLLQHSKKQSGQLIISKGKGHNLQNVLQRLLQELKAHYPYLKSIEQIRSSVITKWLKHYHLRKVQYMAGHRYVSSTERYQQNNIEELQHIINKCGLPMNF